jgi:hypothetical protein
VLIATPREKSMLFCVCSWTGSRHIPGSAIPWVSSLFSKNGVQPSLISLLISYFEDREMRVKWHGKLSQPRKLPGGGAMGASLGNWEFLSQTNDNANCVPEEDRFKFVDDLTTLEIINLLTIGLSSLYMKNHVPSDQCRAIREIVGETEVTVFV